MNQNVHLPIASVAGLASATSVDRAPCPLGNFFTN